VTALRRAPHHPLVPPHLIKPMPTIPHDKALHFIYGALVFCASYLLTAFQQLPALHIAAGAVVVAGVGKEVYDHLNRDKHTPDLMDAVATVAGGVVCSLPLLVSKML